MIENDLNTDRPTPWALLAEDDKLFVTLFSRFWSESYPGVALLSVDSVKQGQRVLSSQDTPPCVAVLDHHLRDGSSEPLKAALGCPVVVWSAVENGDMKRKPQGRRELLAAVEQIGKLGFIDVSRPRHNVSPQ